MRITIIGSGSVATHMAAALKNAGHSIVQVYSRNLQHASLLAYHVGAEAVDHLEAVNAGTDLLIIAVNDNAIGSVANALSYHGRLMIHTSGSTNLAVLKETTVNCGVLYPLQTFNKNKELDFSTVPLCVEGATDAVTKTLLSLAATISNNVYKVDSQKRRTLHLAAVFACNFPNFLYNVANELLVKDGLSFDLLRPLILETADKVQQRLPVVVQTGPAVRNDTTTMDTHLQMLQDEEFLRKLYQLMSEGIRKMAKNDTPA